MIYLTAYLIIGIIVGIASIATTCIFSAVKFKQITSDERVTEEDRHYVFYGNKGSSKITRLDIFFGSVSMIFLWPYGLYVAIKYFYSKNDELNERRNTVIEEKGDM